MSKITLASLTSLQNDNTATALINSNSNIVTSAVDNTLSRDGTLPNQMEAYLDMNSHRIINIPAPVLGGEVVTLNYLDSLLAGPLPTFSPGVPTNVLLYETFAAAQSATIPALTTYIVLEGFYSRGDGGGAKYQKVTVAPYQLTSADGTHWRIDEAQLNVKMFGAKGNGSWDDSSYIMLADSVADTLNNSLYFPGGSYKVNSVLTPASNSHWIGQGPQATVIVTGSAGATVIDISNNSVIIEGFFISSSVVRNASSIGINISGLSAIVRDVDILFQGIGIKTVPGVFGGVSPTFLLERMNVRSNNAFDADFAGCFIGSVISCNFTGGTSPAPGANLRISQCDQLQVLNCNFLGGDNGILVRPSTGQYVYNVRGLQSYVDSPATTGILLWPDSTGIISNFTWDHGWISSASSKNVLVQGASGNVSEISFNDNYMQGIPATTGNAFYILQANNVKLSGNTFTHYASSAIVLDGCIGSKILDNTMVFNILTGVQLLNTTDYCRIVNNDLRGATSGISNTASGTHNTIGSNDT